eukprot:GFYU01003406.1.p1 GENE.GFYU01003406.1~~GFYU01003406.1.p1  ORF type:complete len:448 (-),score=116.20 GFYU01003406.1:63-1406(-)
MDQPEKSMYKQPDEDEETDMSAPLLVGPAPTMQPQPGQALAEDPGRTSGNLQMLTPPPSDEQRADMRRKFSVREAPAAADSSVIAVYIAKFDTLKGNMVEWSHPPEFAVSEQVAFRAICSGWHKLSNDFVYFKYDDCFSIACFNNLHVENSEERGARMRSVGVFVKSFSGMQVHFDFLHREARKLNQEDASDVSRLIAYYNEHKRTSTGIPRPMSREGTAELVKPMTFAHFLYFLGQQAWVIWKALLLRRRVLFYTPVPVGVVCDRVHSATFLLLYDDSAAQRIDCLVPLFYVNVADIDDLSRLTSYVACTTEKIFEMKNTLYDVFVNNQNVVVKDADKKVLKVTSTDKKKFLEVMALCSSQTVTRMDTSRQSSVDDNRVKEFFTAMNDTLFERLDEINSMTHPVITSADMADLGLDKSDTLFLQHLLHVHGFSNIEVKAGGPCPCC